MHEPKSIAARQTMPFQSPRHQHARSASQQLNHDNYYGATNAIYASGQTLSSVGSPTSHWPAQNLSNLQGGDTQTYNQYGANQNGMSLPYRSNTTSYNPSALEAQTSYHTPRRSLTIGRRQVEELHSPQSGTAMSDVHHYGAPPAYGGDNVAINFQPSTPQQASSAANNPLPGNLQPGQANRPPMMATNTAPILPTLPQITTQMQHPPMSARPSTMNTSHSYSRSSPGAFEQPKYKPFSNTPEQQKYTSPTTGNYMSQMSGGPPSYSPLGLADIRPRADTNFSDMSFSPGTIQDSEVVPHSTTSNYSASWPIYAADWCKWPPRSTNGAAGKIAIGSYLEDNHNFIQVLDAQLAQTDHDNSPAELGLHFTKTAEATHAYPVTRILWEPPSANKQTTDLLATSGDHLRLWSLPADQQQYQSNNITRPGQQPLQKLSPLALLSNSKSPEHTAPITSLDWNIVQPSLIITSSIDTTCTIWDIPTLTAKTQLIAHDKEVFDVRFCANSVDVFVSCGADGSVRMFDLRSLEHSTIIYEPSEKTDKNGTAPHPCSASHTNHHPAQVTPESISSSPTRSSQQTMSYPPPLLRIAASPHDAHLLATFSQDSSIIRVLDVRQPGQALLELRGHGSSVNCIEWSSTQRGVLASGADDCCVLLWDLMTAQGGLNPPPQVPQTNAQGQVVQAQGMGQERGPSAMWECGFEVSNLSWAPGLNQNSVGGTLGVCGGRGFWGVQL